MQDKKANSSFFSLWSSHIAFNSGRGCWLLCTFNMRWFYFWKGRVGSLWKMQSKSKEVACHQSIQESNTHLFVNGFVEWQDSVVENYANRMTLMQLQTNQAFLHFCFRYLPTRIPHFLYIASAFPLFISLPYLNSPFCLWPFLFMLSLLFIYLYPVFT